MIVQGENDVSGKYKTVAQFDDWHPKRDSKQHPLVPTQPPSPLGLKLALGISVFAAMTLVDFAFQ